MNCHLNTQRTESTAKCIQDILHALTRVIPVKKSNPKLTQGRRQQVPDIIEKIAWVVPLPLTKPLVTPKHVAAENHTATSYIPISSQTGQSRPTDV